MSDLTEGIQQGKSKLVNKKYIFKCYIIDLCLFKFLGRGHESFE